MSLFEQQQRHTEQSQGLLPMPVKHQLTRCAKCENSIHGVRYKCLQCGRFDLCEQCYPSNVALHAYGEHVFALLHREIRPCYDNLVLLPFLYHQKDVRTEFSQKNGGVSGGPTAPSVSSPSPSSMFSSFPSVPSNATFGYSTATTTVTARTSFGAPPHPMSHTTATPTPTSSFGTSSFGTMTTQNSTSTNGSFPSFSFNPTTAGRANSNFTNNLTHQSPPTVAVPYTNKPYDYVTTNSAKNSALALNSAGNDQSATTMSGFTFGMPSNNNNNNTNTASSTTSATFPLWNMPSRGNSNNNLDIGMDEI